MTEKDIKVGDYFCKKDPMITVAKVLKFFYEVNTKETLIKLYRVDNKDVIVETVDSLLKNWSPFVTEIENSKVVQTEEEYLMTDEEYDNLKPGNLVIHKDCNIEEVIDKAKFHKVTCNGEKYWTDCIIYGNSTVTYVRERDDFRKSFKTYKYKLIDSIIISSSSKKL